MEKYNDCKKYMFALQEVVDNIHKVTRREEVEELERQAKDLIQRLHLKTPYMVQEVHDLGVKKRSEIMDADSKFMFEVKNAKVEL